MKSIIKKLFRSNAFFEAYRILHAILDGNPITQSLNRELFNRKGWLWSRKALPNYEIKIPDQQYTLTRIERESLASDLLDSYHLAREIDPENHNISKLWKSILDKNAKSIESILNNKDVPELTDFLENLFLQDDFWGIGGGSLNYNQGSRVTQFCIYNQLVGLLEYFGLVQRECAEQGAQGESFHFIKSDVIEKLEEKLGFQLDFPRISNAYGIEFGSRFVDLQTLEHVYVSRKVTEALSLQGLRKCNNILEIGAGFAGACHWLNQQIGYTNYIIVDLPIANLYQGWFLSNVYGRDKVKLYNQFQDSKTLDFEGEGSNIYIIPASSESNICSDVKFDLVFNENSFPEMPEIAVKRYLEFISERLCGIFFSYNHEAIQATQGEKQVCVPTLIQNTVGFKRLSRNLSWVRDGYVEEVYVNNE